MRRDLPEGCDYRVFPRFGYGRILASPSMAANMSECYCSVQFGNTLYLLIFGRYFERRSISFIRRRPEAQQPDPIDPASDPWAGDAERAVLDELQRLDPGKVNNRRRRALQAVHGQRSGPA